MIKCETHLHTYGGSPCGQTLPGDIAKEYSMAGYGAIIVTNHYMKYLFDNYYRQKSEKEKIKYYIDLYKDVKKHSQPYGIKVFLGLELNPDCMNTPTVMPAAEFLCYGVSEKFLYDNPKLYDLTQRQLYELFNENNILMFQAHPFRSYCVLGDKRYMHGAEVYNAHPFQNNNNEKSLQFAKENALIGISGSDYHDTGGIGGGIMLPEEINTNEELVEFLRGGNFKLIKRERDL